MSRDQNAGGIHSLRMNNSTFERVEEFKYLGTTLTNQNAIQEEIKSRLRAGNACYYAVQNLLSSRLLSKNLKIKIYRLSQEDCARLREGVPYVKVYRYNPKHLCPKLNGYGNNGHRNVWASGVSTYCTPSVMSYLSNAHARPRHGNAVSLRYLWRHKITDQPRSA